MILLRLLWIFLLTFAYADGVPSKKNKSTTNHQSTPKQVRIVDKPPLQERDLLNLEVYRSPGTSILHLFHSAEKCIRLRSANPYLIATLQKLHIQNYVLALLTSNCHEMLIELLGDVYHEAVYAEVKYLEKYAFEQHAPVLGGTPVQATDFVALRLRVESLNCPIASLSYSSNDTLRELASWKLGNLGVSGYLATNAEPNWPRCDCFYATDTRKYSNYPIIRQFSTPREYIRNLLGMSPFSKNNDEIRKPRYFNGISLIGIAKLFNAHPAIIEILSPFYPNYCDKRFNRQSKEVDYQICTNTDEYVKSDDPKKRKDARENLNELMGKLCSKKKSRRMSSYFCNKYWLLQAGFWRRYEHSPHSGIGLAVRDRFFREFPSNYQVWGPRSQLLPEYKPNIFEKYQYAPMKHRRYELANAVFPLSPPRPKIRQCSLVDHHFPLISYSYAKTLSRTLAGPFKPLSPEILPSKMSYVIRESEALLFVTYFAHSPQGMLNYDCSPFMGEIIEKHNNDLLRFLLDNGVSPCLDEMLIEKATRSNNLESFKLLIAHGISKCPWFSRDEIFRTHFNGMNSSFVDFFVALDANIFHKPSFSPYSVFEIATRQEMFSALAIFIEKSSRISLDDIISLVETFPKETQLATAALNRFYSPHESTKTWEKFTEILMVTENPIVHELVQGKIIQPEWYLRKAVQLGKTAYWRDAAGFVKDNCRALSYSFGFRRPVKMYWYLRWKCTQEMFREIKSFFGSLSHHYHQITDTAILKRRATIQKKYADTFENLREWHWTAHAWRTLESKVSSILSYTQGAV